MVLGLCQELCRFLFWVICDELVSLEEEEEENLKHLKSVGRTQKL